MVNQTVFISHANLQTKFAFAVDKLLERNNFYGFLYERDFPRTSDFIYEIGLHLSQSSYAIALLTPAFLSSNWCMKELTLAHSANKLIPILVEECDITKLPMNTGFIDFRGLAEDEMIESLGELIKSETIFENLHPSPIDFSDSSRFIEEITIALCRFNGDADQIDEWEVAIDELKNAFVGIPYLKFVEVDQVVTTKEEGTGVLEELGYDVLLWGSQKDSITRIGSNYSKGWEFPLHAAIQGTDTEFSVITEDHIELAHLAYTLEFALGSLELSRNRPGEALPRFHKADDYAIDAAPLRDAEKAKAFVKNFELAILYLRTAEAFKSLGEYSLALENFNLASAFDPDNANIYNNRGVVYSLGITDLDAAMQDFNHAIHLDNSLAVAYHNRGSIYERTGDLDSAFEDYSTAIDLGKDLVAYFRRGQIFAMRGEFTKALEDLNNCLENLPNFERGYASRGVVHDALGQFKEALADYDTALDLNPDIPEALYNRGNLLFDLGEFSLAKVDFVRYLKIAEALDPDLLSRAGIRTDLVNKIAARIQIIDRRIDYR